MQDAFHVVLVDTALQGMLVYAHNVAEMRDYWISTCINATKTVCVHDFRLIVIVSGFHSFIHPMLPMNKLVPTTMATFVHPILILSMGKLHFSPPPSGQSRYEAVAHVSSGSEGPGWTATQLVGA